jgi:predicted nucleic acid-binding Zn finger protein
MRSDPRALPGNEQFCSCRAFIIALKTGCKPETAKPTATPWVKKEREMQAVSLQLKNSLESIKYGLSLKTPKRLSHYGHL